MTTVTSITAAKAMEILNGTIASALVNGDGDLILTKVGGGTINAGPVIGPEGPMGSVSPSDLTAAITSFEVISGKGIIGHAENDTDQDWGLLSGTFYDLPGLSVTFDAVEAKAYRFDAAVLVSSVASGGAYFDAEIVSTGGTVFSYGSAFTGATDLKSGINLSRVYVAEPGFAGSRTVKLRVRSRGDELATTHGTDVATYISVTDLGVIF